MNDRYPKATVKRVYEHQLLLTWWNNITYECTNGSGTINVNCERERRPNNSDKMRS